MEVLRVVMMMEVLQIMMMEVGAMKMITQTGTFPPRYELNCCTSFSTDSVLSLATMMAGMAQIM